MASLRHEFALSGFVVSARKFSSSIGLCEQWAAVSWADVIIYTHGSAHANFFALRPSTTVVELTPYIVNDMKARMRCEACVLGRATQVPTCLDSDTPLAPTARDLGYGARSQARQVIMVRASAHHTLIPRRLSIPLSVLSLSVLSLRLSLSLSCLTDRPTTSHQLMHQLPLFCSLLIRLPAPSLPTLFCYIGLLTRLSLPLFSQALNKLGVGTQHIVVPAGRGIYITDKASGVMHQSNANGQQSNVTSWGCLPPHILARLVIAQHEQLECATNSSCALEHV